MKAFTFVLGGALILAAPLRGQQTQVLTENDQIKVELTKYMEPCSALFAEKGNSTPQGATPTCTELAITNKSRLPITAWVAITETDSPQAPHRPPALGIRSSDSVALAEDNRNNPQILPRDTHRVTMGNPTRADFKAAVFSDGSVFGDPEWVQRIVENRRHIYQETAIALQRLRAAKGAGTGRQQLVPEFRELQRQEKEQELRSHHALARPASLILSTLDVYGAVAGNLERDQAEGNAGTLGDDIDRLVSMMLDLGNRMLVSRPPVSDHPVLLGEPLDSPPPPGHASNPAPSAGIP